MEVGKPTANPYYLKLVEEAKKRALAKVQTASLPSSVDLVTSRPPAIIVDDVAAAVIYLTKEGQRFDPFELDGLILNEQQRQAVELFGIKGDSGCLIGPAGTGKTTTMKAVIRAAILSGRIPILPEDMEHKYLQGGLPGIYGGSFTRIATRNLRDNCPEDIKGNIHTIHRLLEFEPETITVWDDILKKDKKIKIFKPTRHTFRTLDEHIYMFLLDESSMIGTDLHAKLLAAIPPGSKAQFLYIGDIAQLPPVMDDAVLGYKMLEFIEKKTLVELTQVYRHAGAIVNLANDIRVGLTIPRGRVVAPFASKPHKLPLKVIGSYLTSELGYSAATDNRWEKEEDGSKVTLQIWKNRLDGDVGQLRALQNLGLSFFPKEYDLGNYLPEEHMILMPYNKSVGTLELNRYIAQYLGKKRNAEVFEVIAGYNKVYLAVGDKVFFDREEALITKIDKNGMYAGKIPQAPSVTLDRWGHNTAGVVMKDDAFDDVAALLNIDVGTGDEEERKNQASHSIKVKKIVDIRDDKENATEYTLNTASEINSLLGGYALTIHKSQGSQWRKVYCVFHNSHNRNLQRELLYTAITRAQKELFVICEPETLVQGVLSQHIVGNTLSEKAEYFKGKVAADKLKQDLFNKEEE